MEPDPLARTKGGVLLLVTCRFITLVVWPWATERVFTAGLGTREKLSVVAVTAKLTLVMAEGVPEDPFTITFVVPVAALGAV